MTISDIVMICLTFTYVITTILILKSSNKQFKENIRPRVYVDFKFLNAIMYIVVKNIGERAAHNINIKFDPDIKYEKEETLNNIPLIKNLPFLSPKNELDTVLGTGFDILPRNKFDRVEAIVKYEDEKNNEYTEKHSFSLEAYSKRIYREEKDINNIVDELKGIKEAIKNK